MIQVPKAFVSGSLVLATVAIIPPVLIARLRAVNSPQPRVHIIQDMDNQPRYKSQQASPLFADGRAMRPPVEGTVARGGLELDEHYFQGVVDEAWATTFPSRVSVTPQFIRHGQERFDIYCQPCHGLAGYGDGMVNQRAMQLMEAGVNGTTWVQPKSIHDADIRAQPVGQIFNTITNGVRNMPAYGPQIPVRDRWAIVAYVRALQRSQNARPQDVPAAERDRLPTIRLDQEQSP